MKKVNLYSRKVAAYLAVGMTLAAAQAHAAIDVSAVTTALGEGEDAVKLIGGAILLVWAIKKVYSMIKGG